MVNIVHHTMHVVSFRSDELQFDYATKQVKLTKVAKLSKPCCEILSFFYIVCVGYPFRNTKHDRILPENRIETRLNTEEIERDTICCNPDESNRFADAIHFANIDLRYGLALMLGRTIVRIISSHPTAMSCYFPKKDAELTTLVLTIYTDRLLFVVVFIAAVLDVSLKRTAVGAM